MAYHNSTHSLIEEAITEYLAIANYCLMTAKPTGGCYGYPTALLLFSIVDAIGSFYKGDSSISIKIDGTNKTIKKDSQHYFILNSNYYNQKLSGKEIEKLYEYYRCRLVHNAALAPGCFLEIGELTDVPFAKQENSNTIDIVNLTPFAELSHNAVSKFLKVAPSIIPNSKQGKIINKKL